MGVVLLRDKNLPGVAGRLAGVQWAGNDPASPLNGIALRDLNGAQRGVAAFLRGPP